MTPQTPAGSSPDRPPASPPPAAQPLPAGACAPVLDWAAARHAGPAVAGGKGWQLARMAELGVPVPPGFVLPAQASAAHHAGRPVPDDVAQALRDALQARGWLDTPLALRSSAPQEDGGAASFAGIHLSCLNVQGEQAAIQALQRIWDSAWTPQADAYRQRLGLSAEDRAMAVVVMPLVAATASGIAFTCDPLTGRHDHMVIHANWGLGESLVGGQADGDEYRLCADAITLTWRLLDARIGTKRRTTRPIDGGGTRLVDQSAEQAARAVLTAAQVDALAELVRDAARVLDYSAAPYDVEWAWDGSRFWIVQARPVTALARHTYPGLQSQPSYWSRGNTREVLPQPMSALEWDGGRLMAQRMLTCGFELSGYRPLPGVRMVAMFQGRAYLDASVIQWLGHDALGIAPRAMNAMLGGPQPGIQVPKPTLAQRLQHGTRMLRYLRRAAPLRRTAKDDLPRQFARAQAWLDATLPASNAALGARLHEQFLTVALADDLFFLQGSGGGALSKLLEIVERARPGAGHALTAALMAGGEPSVTAAQSYALMALAQLAAREPQALAWLRASERDSAAWADQLPTDSAFRRALADFLARYGHRAVYETYMRNPRWREAPGYILDSVLSLIGADPDALRARQEKGARDAWRQVRAVLPWWQRPLAAKLLAAARVEGAQREAARSVLVAYLAAVRRCALELGARLTGKQKSAPQAVDPTGLAAPDDIFHLTAEEVFALADGRLAPHHAGRRAADRRAQLQDWIATPDVDVIVEYGDAAASREDRAAPPRHATPDATIDAGVWRGTPVSAGRTQGPAFIARDPVQALAMPAGAVLIAPSTDPAWTPLFLRASAVVMQAGGYLSHGAIVAREFGVPALVNVQGILQQAAAGDWLDVDATQGVVRRLRGADPDPAAHSAANWPPAD